MPGTRCLHVTPWQQPLTTPSVPVHARATDRARPSASCQGEAILSIPSTLYPCSYKRDLPRAFCPCHQLPVRRKSPPRFPVLYPMWSTWTAHLAASPSLCAGHEAPLSPSTSSQDPGAPPSTLEHRRTIVAPVRSASTTTPSWVCSQASPPYHASTP
jgi:hypothetical protein